VSEILDDLKPAIASSRSEVHVDSLPAVQADAAQLRQLFQNLISNALKYHDATRPNRIRVSAHHEGADWVFAISDTGIGMENQYLEQIFVIFQRLHNRADYEGNGIGLAICKKIVEAHRGRIWVESTPGEGTTFFFTWSAGIAARKEDAA
jgi:light-regulated signal transduction histidine kinase (bacteriophytochrome)